MDRCVEAVQKNKKILIVDDESDICYFLRRNFSQRGFSTAISHSLADAEQELEANRPSIMLLDNHLPDGKGVDFANKISNKYPEVTIIMITAYDTQLDRVKAFGNGISFFLPKPFSMKGINEVVDLVA